ncbi:MAG: hypothetical protein JRF30_03015 [Deltaproteobacteria bacterium]|nr:hypothetical protein [Deltaproteobacteria bacterium]MBW2329906.1 hypothetical protein [Deltaproteobacteria bacterium]
MSSNNLPDIENRLNYLIELDIADDDSLKDPLALAIYLHFFNKHDRVGIHKARLVNWARSFSYQVIVERKITKKRDTEIAAAVLLTAEQQADEGIIKEKRKKLHESIPELLSNEIDKDGLFFGNPTLSAVILYALQILQLSNNQEDIVLKALLRRYTNKKTFTHILGLVFLIKVLLMKGDIKPAKEVVDLAKERLGNQQIDYDDNLYLVAVLWDYYKSADRANLIRMKSTAERVIKYTPILISDIVNKGDISDVSPGVSDRKISRLYKAVFFDFLESYKESREALQEEELDQKYKGSYGFKWLLIFTTPFIVSLPAAIIWIVFKNELKAGIDFWVFKDISFSWFAISINTAILLFLGYTITLGITAFVSIFNSIVIKKIESERRILEHLFTFQKKVLKTYWLTVVGGIFVVSILQLFIGGALQTKLTM